MPKNRRKLWNIFIACFLCANLIPLGVKESVFAQSKPDLTYDIVLLIDESEGMIFADADNTRIEDAKNFINYLNTIDETFPIDIFIAIAGFNQNIIHPVSLRRINNYIADEIKPASNLNQEIKNYTLFEPATQFAIDELDINFEKPNNKQLVIILSDGIPGEQGAEFPDPKLEGMFEVFRPNLETLIENNVDVRLLNWGPDGKITDHTRQTILEQTKKHWKDSNVEIFENSLELNSLFQDQLSRILSTVPEKGNLTSKETTIPIEPYLEKAIFSYYRDTSDAEIMLFDPSGSKINITQSNPSDLASTVNDSRNLFLSRSIDNPITGSWKIVWNNIGNVKFWVDKYPPELISSIDPKYPAIDQPIAIRAQLRRNNKNINDKKITLFADISRSSSADPTTPVKTITLPLSEKDEQYAYEGELDLPKGEYLIKFRARYNDFDIPLQQKTIEFPILPIQKITQPPNQQIITLTPSIIETPDVTTQHSFPGSLNMWLIISICIILAIMVFAPVLYRIYISIKINQILEKYKREVAEKVDIKTRKAHLIHGINRIKNQEGLFTGRPIRIYSKYLYNLIIDDNIKNSTKVEIFKTFLELGKDDPDIRFGTMDAVIQAFIIKTNCKYLFSYPFRNILKHKDFIQQARGYYEENNSDDNIYPALLRDIVNIVKEVEPTQLIIVFRSLLDQLEKVRKDDEEANEFHMYLTRLLGIIEEQHNPEDNPLRTLNEKYEDFYNISIFLKNQYEIISDTNITFTDLLSENKESPRGYSHIGKNKLFKDFYNNFCGFLEVPESTKVLSVLEFENWVHDYFVRLRNDDQVGDIEIFSMIMINKELFRRYHHDD